MNAHIVEQEPGYRRSLCRLHTAERARAPAYPHSGSLWHLSRPPFSSESSDPLRKFFRQQNVPIHKEKTKPPPRHGCICFGRSDLCKETTTLNNFCTEAYAGAALSIGGSSRLLPFISSSAQQERCQQVSFDKMQYSEYHPRATCTCCTAILSTTSSLVQKGVI